MCRTLVSLFPGYKMSIKCGGTRSYYSFMGKSARSKTFLETLTLCEYEMMFGTAVEDAVEKVSKWVAASYTHP